MVLAAVVGVEAELLRHRELLCAYGLEVVVAPDERRCAVRSAAIRDVGVLDERCGCVYAPLECHVAA